MKKVSLSEFIRKNKELLEALECPSKNYSIPNKIHTIYNPTGLNYQKEKKNIAVKLKISTKQVIKNDYDFKLSRNIRFAKRIRISNDLHFYPFLRRVKQVHEFSLPKYSFRELRLLISHFKFSNMRKLKITDCFFDDLNEMAQFFKSLGYCKNLSRINVIDKEQKGRMSNLIKSCKQKVLESINFRINRLTKLSTFEFNSSTLFKISPSTYKQYGTLISYIPKLALQETFPNSCAEVIHFLEPLNYQYHLYSLHIIVGFHQEQGIGEELGQLSKLQRLILDLRDGIPPKIIQSLSKLQNLRELTWKVDLKNSFYVDSDHFMSQNQGLLQRVTQLSIFKLEYLDLDVLETGDEIYTIFANGLNKFHRLEELRLNFFGQLSNSSFFKNFMPQRLKRMRLTLQEPKIEEFRSLSAKALNEFFSNCQNMEVLVLKIDGVIHYSFVGPICKGIKNMKKLVTLSIDLDKFIYNEGQRELIALSEIFLNLSYLRRGNFVLSKAVNDNDLLLLLEALRGREDQVVIFYYSTFNIIKKNNLSKISSTLNQIRAKKNIFLILSLPSTNYPTLEAWTKK